MKRSKFSESQIIKALKENEQGIFARNLSRELGIGKSTFYYWRKKCEGMEQQTQTIKGIWELEEEKRRLMQMYADVSLDVKMIKEYTSD